MAFKYEHEKRLGRTLHGKEYKTLMNYPENYPRYLPYLHSHKHLSLSGEPSEYPRLYPDNLESVVTFDSGVL